MAQAQYLEVHMTVLEPLPLTSTPTFMKNFITGKKLHFSQAKLYVNIEHFVQNGCGSRNRDPELELLVDLEYVKGKEMGSHHKGLTLTCLSS